MMADDRPVTPPVKDADTRGASVARRKRETPLEEKVMSCCQLLIAAQLEKTAWGSMLIEAEIRGYFSEAEIQWSKHRWPFDGQFSDAVANNRFGPATIRLIRIEKQLAAEGWRAVERYRQERDKDL